MAKNRCMLLLAWCLLFTTSGCGRKAPPLPQSTNLHLEAVTAAMDGDHPTAVDLLTQVIEQEPSPQAYLDRGRSLVALGRIGEALQDCEAGLTLVPDDVDLLWLKAEAIKPESQRFQGRYAEPPSHTR